MAQLVADRYKSQITRECEKEVKHFQKIYMEINYIVTSDFKAFKA